MNLDLFEQRADIWRGRSAFPQANPGIPTGFTDLDALLPGGGWPNGALTEILSDPGSVSLRESRGNGALWLTMPALAQLSQQSRWLTWIAPPHIPYAPALTNMGIDLTKVLLVHPKTQTDTLWALEQALRSGTCSAVLAWLNYVDPKSLRRLQLAAETGKTWGLLFCQRRNAPSGSTAALRLKVEPTYEGVAVEILKRRGGWPVRPLQLRFGDARLNV